MLTYKKERKKKENSLNLNDGLRSQTYRWDECPEYSVALAIKSIFVFFDIFLTAKLDIVFQTIILLI